MASISRIKVCRKVAPLRTRAASCEEPESGPPRPVGLLAGSWRRQRPREYPSIGILAKRWNQVSVVFSRSRLHVEKPLQDGGPTLRKSWLKKRACYDTRALPFRQLPETFFDAPPPRFLHNWARSQTDANGRRRPDKRRADSISRNSEKARLASFDQGFRRSRREGRTPMQAKSPDSRPRPPEGERSNSSFPAPINTRKPRIRPSPSFETSAQTTSSLPQSEGEPRNARRDGASDGGAPHPAVPQSPGDKICGTSSRRAARSDSGCIRGTAPCRVASPSVRADRVGSVVYSDLVVKRCIGRRRRPPCPSAARRKGRM